MVKSQPRRLFRTTAAHRDHHRCAGSALVQKPVAIAPQADEGWPRARAARRWAKTSPPSAGGRYSHHRSNLFAEHRQNLWATAGRPVPSSACTAASASWKRNAPIADHRRVVDLPEAMPLSGRSSASPPPPEQPPAHDPLEIRHFQKRKTKNGVMAPVNPAEQMHARTFNLVASRTPEGGRRSHQVI